MTENIGLRIRYKDTWVIITPSETDFFRIDFAGLFASIKVDERAQLEALEHLQPQIDIMRQQIWRLIKEKRAALTAGTEPSRPGER